MIAENVKNLPRVRRTDNPLREAAFARMIERGIADSDQGRTIDHDEVERIIASWGK